MILWCYSRHSLWYGFPARCACGLPMTPPQPSQFFPVESLGACLIVVISPRVCILRHSLWVDPSLSLYPDRLLVIGVWQILHVLFTGGSFLGCFLMLFECCVSLERDVDIVSEEDVRFITDLQHVSEFHRSIHLIDHCSEATSGVHMGVKFRCGHEGSPQHSQSYPKVMHISQL